MMEFIANAMLFFLVVTLGAVAVGLVGTMWWLMFMLARDLWRQLR